MNVARFLIEVMEGIGITQGFSLVGGMSMYLNYAADSSNMSVLYCNHEQAVVAAADGYTKAADFELPGLAIVTSGPGVTNVITSLASAYYDSVPLILLSGQVKSADINHYGVRSHGAQEVPHIALLQTITKSSFIYEPTKISNLELASHLALSMTGRKGPVHIDIPLDIQNMEIKSRSDVLEVVELYKAYLAQTPTSSNILPTQMLNDLRNAQRPLIVLGNGLKIASVPGELINKLVNYLGIPVLFTWASMDLLDYGHDLAFGSAGGLAGVHSNRILQAADVIIFLGARLDLLTTGFNPTAYGKNATRYSFECDQAELDKYANVKNLNGYKLDVRAVLHEILVTPIGLREEVSMWTAQCKSWKVEDQEAEKNEFSEPRLNSYHIADLISRSSSTKYVVPTASGYAIEGFARFYKTTRGSRFAWAGHVLGSMGLALPSAIGASARLKHCVACVDGDGGFLLNMQELMSLKANPDLAIAIFILNNRGYTSIRVSQSRAFNGNFGSSVDSGLADVDYSILANLANLSYMECDSYESLSVAISDIGPASRILINVMMEEEVYRGPAIQTKFDASGRPYSTDLESIAWR